MKNIVNKVNGINENGFLEVNGTNFTLFLGEEEIQAMEILLNEPNKIFIANQYIVKMELKNGMFKIKSQAMYFEEEEEILGNVLLPVLFLPQILENSKNGYLQNITNYGVGYKFSIE